MTTRKPRNIAGLVLAAFLLGAPGASRAEGPAAPAVVPDNAATLNAPATDNAAGLTTVPDNAAALNATTDNAAAPAVVPDNGTTVSTPPGTDAQPPPPAEEEPEMREPSFAAESPPAPRVADPIEPVNRGVFYVNDKLYRWVLKPVAKGYAFVVPEGARVAVRNFFFNLATPIRAVNALLQGKIKATGTELARFGINSTVGFGGFFDAAKEWGLRRTDEDTGQTFGVWGIGNGFYIVLPLLGPSTARDTVGIVGDVLLDPTTYLLRPRDAIYARVIRSENDLSFRLDEYEELTAAAVDPYVAVRNAYIQHRAKRVRE
jgi:phospholipid-binding lipoprotein MlaA